MSTAKQRRRKGGRKSKRRQNRRAGIVSDLRQRVTMEVARLANVLGMVMGLPQHHGIDIWTFSGPEGHRMTYYPLTGRWYDKAAYWDGVEPDVLKVLEMAARINSERGPNQ